WHVATVHAVALRRAIGIRHNTSEQGHGARPRAARSSVHHPAAGPWHAVVRATGRRPMPVFPGCYAAAPWHFLNLRPLPHGHGSFRPTLLKSTAPGPLVPAARFCTARPAPT